jgi:hypothetical protein
MSYIGNTSTQQSFIAAVDTFNGNGSTTAFTLSRSVLNVFQIEAVIENVPQDPNSAYTVNGNTITFTSAPPSGTGNIYVRYTSPITQLIAPGPGTVTPSTLSLGGINWDASGNVTTLGTINNITVGRGAGSVSTNTAVGASALAANTTGASNTAVGQNALLVNADGAQNTAVGRAALTANTSGSLNVAIGRSALLANTSGANNTAVGSSALAANTTASKNTAVGFNALYSNTGNFNSAFGAESLYSNTTGTLNTALGRDALFDNTTGSYNVAVGQSALENNTTASYSTAVGHQALNTANRTADGNGGNTALGWQAGYSATTGQYNTFVGLQAGYSVIAGSKNTLIGGYTGNQGGIDIRTSNANNNVILSDGDGGNLFGFWSAMGHFWNSTGTYTQNNWLNSGVQKAAMWWDNSLLRLVTYTGTTVGPYISNNGTSWTNSSDERLKNITGEIQNGLTKVCSLRAAEYTWKSDETATPQVGLIAQDVLAVLPEAVTVPKEGATERDGSPAMMGVQYNEVIPLLVAAIKELKAEIDLLKGVS